MLTWQEGPPPAFDDWAEMREVYLSLLRPRWNATAELLAQRGRDGRLGSGERIDSGAGRAPRHLAPSAGHQNIV